jgi:multidrug efflux system outer membrane protein
MKRFILLAISALALGGCMLGPEYERSPGLVPPDFRFQIAQEDAASIADIQWWEMYQDPVLQELINTALQHNFNARVAMQRVAEARAAAGISRSVLLPQLSGVALYQWQGVGRETVYPPIPENISTPDSLTRLNFDLYWEIDLFGRLSSLSQAAQATFFASEWGQQAVLISVVADVAAAYFELRALDRQLEIANSTLASFENSRRLVELRFNQGVVSREALAQAEALVHIAGTQIPDLELQIARKENQICILLGDNPHPIARGKTLAEQTVQPAVPAGLPSTLLERRPDIRQAEQLLIASNFRIGAARANFFPRIAITGLYGRQSVEMSDLFSGATTLWNIGPSVSLPIFTGGANYFTLKRTEAQQEQALTLYQFTVRQAFREVADGLAAHTLLQDLRLEQEALVQSYQQYAELANKRFQGGITSFLSVLDSERQLFNAKLALISVQRNQFLTLVQLYKALGGGLDVPAPEAENSLAERVSQNAHAAQ